MTFFLILLVPFPSTLRYHLTTILSNTLTSDIITQALKIMFGIVTLLFLDSFYKLYQSPDPVAERNIILTGGILFLTVVLERFYGMVVEIAKFQVKKEVK